MDFDIYIYGAGEVGEKCYKKYKEMDIEITAIIDKNKSGWNVIEGVYVYKLDSQQLKEIDFSHALIIICLADGMIHKNVASDLFRLGFKYIIFLPMCYPILDVEKRRLTRLYNNAIKGIISKDEIKSYENYDKYQLSTNNVIIRENNGTVLVWLNQEILFTENPQEWDGDKNKIHGKDIIKDRNILCNDPHENLFRFFELEVDNSREYFESYKEKKTELQVKIELSKRERLYREFKCEHNRGMEFFIEGAPKVKWNEKGYFNLIGGHHRTMYLLSEGHTLFPVEMDRTDFEKWCNIEQFDRFKLVISENNIDRFYAPIPHPAMLFFPSARESFNKTKLKALLTFFIKEKGRIKSVLECGNGQGYFVRNIERMGECYTYFAYDNLQNLEIVKMINLLLYRKNTICISIDDLIQNNDLLFDMLIVINDCLSYRNTELLIKEYEKKTEHYLVTVINRDIDIKKIIQNSGFTEYEVLHSEYYEGIIEDFVVLKK